MSSHIVHGFIATLAFAAACGAPKTEKPAAAPRVSGQVYTVHDTTIRSTLSISGTADAVRQATLSTKLMGTVVEVLVKEGDVVAAGQPLVRIDARDIAAKQAQVAASMADAEAMQRDAQAQARRIRALYADSAATRAQLDAVETGVARAEAGVRAAGAGQAELTAMMSYAVVRAPFGGIVTHRMVDPGAFAAPGAPLITVQDVSQLRLAVSATPDIARTLRRGQRIDALVEGRAVSASVEGAVPGAAGNLYTVNALIGNANRAFLPGSAATLLVPLGTRQSLVVPATAVVRQGDLTGVTLRTASGDEVRWVRLGSPNGEFIEVNAGLRAGDQVVVPTGPHTVASTGTVIGRER